MGFQIRGVFSILGLIQSSVAARSFNLIQSSVAGVTCQIMNVSESDNIKVLLSYRAHLLVLLLPLTFLSLCVQPVHNTSQNIVPKDTILEHGIEER